MNSTYLQRQSESKHLKGNKNIFTLKCLVVSVLQEFLVLSELKSRESCKVLPSLSADVMSKTEHHSCFLMTDLVYFENLNTNKKNKHPF